MTATVYNPLLYAWMNQTFREEFIRALPFLAEICHRCCPFRSNDARTATLRGRGRPKIITDCEPASNRRNCADHVRERKYTLGMSSTRGSLSVSHVKSSSNGNNSSVREGDNLLEIGDAGKRRSGSLGTDSFMKSNFPRFRDALSRRKSKRRRQSDNVPRDIHLLSYTTDRSDYSHYLTAEGSFPLKRRIGSTDL